MSNSNELKLPLIGEQMLRQRWLPWVLLVMACALLGFLNALESYAAANSFGQHNLEWGRALSWDLLGWGLWIPFTPLILWMGRRFPWGKENWFRTALVYALAGLFLALARTVFQVFVHFFIFYGTQGLSDFIRNKYFVLFSDSLAAIVVYGLILTLGQALNYYRQFRENELKAANLEAQLVGSQLQALKMQIHPHFLFNTLNSISALQMEDTQAAQRMTARLGDFLRLTLENTGTQEVTLKQEIEFLRCYLDIERIRFGRRLTTNIQLDPETLDARVPNLILQPIVENAIKHGIAQRVAPGMIDISARRKQGRLQVQVIDNGPGLMADKDSPDALKEGVGLSNTRARLNWLYGSDYHFELTNVSGGGLAVSLELPFTKNGNANTGV